MNIFKTGLWYLMMGGLMICYAFVAIIAGVAYYTYKGALRVSKYIMDAYHKLNTQVHTGFMVEAPKH